jgi:hypothetical protein
LSSLVLSQGSVVGQQQPIGTLTLSAAAPSGGATIRIESTNPDIAKVPATVTIPAGSTTGTFRVDTATVATRTTARLTATYAGVARTADITVTLPTPRASFTVVSPTRGNDACLLIEQGMQLDCRLDARGSEGILVRWMWVFTAVERFLANKTEPTFVEIDTGGCKFINGVTTSSDDQGKYADMTILLEVQDKDGSTSAPTTKRVKVYTNDYCGT